MVEPALAAAGAAPATERDVPGRHAAALRVVDPAGPATTDGPASPRLEIPAYDMDAALGLERELGVSHVLAQTLVRRGLADPGAAREFLVASDAHPPSAFAGIERAVGVVERHIAAGSRITVHGDYDVDGVCATAIMLRSLRSLGADVDWFLPGRIDDGYGLSSETVERLADRGTRLLITVDCAITAVDEVAQALASGVEVVLTDHHHPRSDGLLPDCPIVHPAVCGYPCPELCGTAVAYKLAQALGAPGIDDEIELVALATVADLMPLRGENRRLVREGLAALASTGRPGLRALMAVSRADPSALDAGTLGFRLAPRINAAGRLRRADAGVELLLTSDPDRARQIALELDQLNAERRAVEQRIAWEAESMVAGLGERSAYVLAGEDWHPGVIGIVASRIVERHHRPTILVAFDGALGAGSGRSIPGFDLLGALDATAGHLERYGGHRAAAGLTVARENLAGFTAAFDRHARSVLTAELLTPVERVDAVVSGSDLGLRLAEELERLEPTGIGNPGVKLLVPGGRLRDVRPMGEGRHVRFSVHAGGSRTPAVAFGCDGRLEVGPDEPSNATFRLERNCWNGAVEPRLVLRRAWRCRPSPIRVLGEHDDYLTGMSEELASLVPPVGSPPSAVERIHLDRRGESGLAVLADALTAVSEDAARSESALPGGPAASEEPDCPHHVLAVCTEVSRRIGGLRERTGGFSLVSYHALERRPSLSDGYRHIVALDPPSSPEQAALIVCGAGFTHLAWGEPELRFAQQMHDLEYGLRPSLVSLYRGLRERGRAAGGELEGLLREGRPGRPPRLAARLVAVLSELRLATFDPTPPLLTIAGEAPTALERSAAYRFCAQRHEDGRRFLTSGNLLPSG